MPGIVVIAAGVAEMERTKYGYGDLGLAINANLRGKRATARAA